MTASDPVRNSRCMRSGLVRWLAAMAGSTAVATAPGTMPNRQTKSTGVEKYDTAASERSGTHNKSVEKRHHWPNRIRDGYPGADAQQRSKQRANSMDLA